LCLIPCHDIRFHKLTGAIKGVVHICCGWWNCKPSPFNNNLSYSIHSWTWFCWNQRDLIILLQISQVFELTGQIIMKRPYFYKKLFKKMIDSCSRINCSYDTNNSFWLPLYDEKNNTNAICHTSVPILFHIFCSINMKTIIKNNNNSFHVGNSRHVFIQAIKMFVSSYDVHSIEKYGLPRINQ
jgi:hypothetical protein